MTSPHVPRNAYTNSPEQHPNLILGSLQLLFWFVFRPSALQNHLKRINLKRINSDRDFDSKRKTHLRSQRRVLWKLRIQALIVLHLINSIVLALVFLRLGVAVEEIAWVVAFLVALFALWDMALFLAWGEASGVMSGLAWGIGFIINTWMIILYPLITVWNILLYQLDKRRKGTQPSCLRWHSAFWYEHQFFPLQGLDKHVLLVIERHPEEGKAALKYLSKSFFQDWATKAVQIELDTRQIELDARELERCEDVVGIANTYPYLALRKQTALVSSYLMSFCQISQDIEAALNQNSVYNQRLALIAVAKRLNGLIRELSRSDDRHDSRYDIYNTYAPRFHSIAIRWHEIVTNYAGELVEAVELRQEIGNPYIIGPPLTEQQEIFTGRTDIGTRIEQLLLDRRRPPLLLYGQRRMGKTSLLNNLGRLLPSTIIPMFVDLQGPVSSASNYAGFPYNIARSMITSAKHQRSLTLPSLDRATLQDDPFTRFDEWLDEVEQKLEQNTALLALDEFEVLDNAITKGRFDEQEVLGMLRHLIQHRPRFKVMIAGSHTIEEFQRWASYLINVQVIHISYLKEPEARQLIERPVTDFTLRYEPDAVDRALQLTRCHPYLIQLLCGEIVNLKNEQDPSIRRLATLADVEAAIPSALSVGSFFFADIQNNQVDAAGLAILQFLAARGEGATVSRQTILQHFPDAFDALDLLMQREAIEKINDGYRFQVELIRRWFANVGSG